MADPFMFPPRRAWLSPVSALLLLCGLIASPAAADTVTFNRDIPGNKALGFTSVDSNLLSFWDATGIQCRN